MNKMNQYTIQFSGLKDGKHDFTFEIGKELFAFYENSDIIDAKIVIKAMFEKKVSLLSFQFEIKGTIKTTCDRCLEVLELEIQDSPDLYINFGETTSDITDIDDTMILARSEDKIDLSKHFYDYIVINLPIQKIHPQDKNGKSTCNPDMLKKLETYLSQDTKKNETDPRWDKLKNLFN
jgi:uncharacterized metal-binding protein YceD (DUF177 family)